MSDFKNLARSAYSVNNERRFVLDYEFHISKPVYCEICGKRIHDGNYPRMWFEISREIYRGWMKGKNKKKKGLTICHDHSKKEVSDFAMDKYLEGKKDSKLTDAEFIVRNDSKEYDSDILYVAADNLESFKLFCQLKRARSHGKRFVEKNEKIDTKTIKELERNFNKFRISKKYFGIDSINSKLDSLEGTLNQLFGRKVNKNNKVKNRINSLERYVADIIFFRFLNLGEVPITDYFRERIYVYAEEWYGLNSEERHVDKDELLKEFAELGEELTEGFERMKELMEKVKLL